MFWNKFQYNTKPYKITTESVYTRTTFGHLDEIEYDNKVAVVF